MPQFQTFTSLSRHVPAKEPSFDDLLSLRTRAEIRTALSNTGMRLTLPQAQRLAVHAEALEPSTRSLRLGIVHTYTSDLLEPWLELSAALQGLTLSTYHAPYGLSLQEAQTDSPLVRHEPDITLLLLQRGDLHPDLAEPLAGFTPAQLEKLRNSVLDRLAGIVSAFRTQKTGLIALSLLPAVLPPGAGLYDAQSGRSETAWWSLLKIDIGRWLRQEVQAAVFLDLDEVLHTLGRDAFFDLRFWYTARYPFSTAAARDIARRLIALGVVLKLPKAKVIAVDADNTLWGGIIGEDGIEGIALGPEYPGNAYLDFQRRLLDYRQRGFVLALCSKNNPADVDAVLSGHPHQLLRDEHFAARRVNWSPKSENLVSLAEELNLGLDSFIFVDDSAHECAAVRHDLPQVEVVHLPTKPVLIPGCLDQIARLEILSLTDEDLVRTEMYAQERRRREFQQSAGRGTGNLKDYLISLGMKMRISIDPSTHLARLAQLTQKTNQFNLTTRRYDEQQMKHFIADDGWLVADFSLSDVFGDSGIVGLAIFRRAADTEAELDTFLMSCRVIGREAESAFLNALLQHLARRGVDRVVADFVPTPKNALAKDFLAMQGFSQSADERYFRDLRASPPQAESTFPIAVDLIASVADVAS